MVPKKGCFSTGCFGSWKHKKTLKKVHDQPLSPRDEQHEAVALLGATTVSPIEKKPVSDSVGAATESLEEKKPVSVSEIDQAKSEEEQMNCKTSSISNSDKLLESENRNLSSPSQEPESSESLFSLSIDSRKQAFTADMGDKEVTSLLKPNNNNNNTSSIVSNKSARLMDDNKENVSLEPLAKQSLVETAVDDTTSIATITSLSGWLNISHKSNIDKSNSNNSPESEKNYDGPTAELKQMNGSDSQLGKYLPEIGPARACLAEIFEEV